MLSWMMKTRARIQTVHAHIPRVNLDRIGEAFQGNGQNGRLNGTVPVCFMYSFTRASVGLAQDMSQKLKFVHGCLVREVVITEDLGIFNGIQGGRYVKLVR